MQLVSPCVLAQKGSLHWQKKRPQARQELSGPSADRGVQVTLGYPNFRGCKPLTPVMHVVP